jgi:uncharacterized BrkB/YihY/UPF0761 family membrane protein
MAIKYIFAYLFSVLTILNALTILGLWRIFYLAVHNGAVNVVSDSGMALEVYAVFPIMIIFNALMFVGYFSYLTEDRKEKKNDMP